MPSINRHLKAERVKDNLKNNHSFDAEQTKIWSEIDSFLKLHTVVSKSSAMDDVYRNKRRDLDANIEKVVWQPDQIGIYVEAAGEFMGMDIVSLPAVWKDLHDKIIRSYLIDVMYNDQQIQDATPERYMAVISDLMNAELLSFKSVGLGDDLRIECPSLTGSFLVWEGIPVHYAVYPKVQKRAREDYDSPRHRRGNWPGSL